ncbi:MAG TPA: T9SS type A sorting domain-containing protein [Candidatus Caccoplasma intestinavium]|uniref:T9SS type A sorting domain-containing protein n=1 Tax=Candidatus Caccoplasma intestinavium TaxID=2840716 RepID=A0A9D1GFT0_9BACT|nr:T9SS type A sorting domain-containing protein [Candidatus Caccoplasma intestinavium]
MKRILLTFCMAFACLAGAVADELIAFPGAEGYGRFARGARAGENPTVYHVTNLNDSGKGSLRDAVSQPNRIVVFDVAGVIRIKSPLVFSKNLTIAGQTAPGSGIVIYGERTSFSGASDIIVRYLRIRMGMSGRGQNDAAGIANGSNMIFDHCSISWGKDETFSINSDGKNGGVGNITIQKTIMSQGLLPHSAGGLCQPTNTVGGVTLYRNLYADNNTRNHKVKGLNQYINNVVYNWGSGGGYNLGGDSEGRIWADVQSNYFIQGPNSGGNGVGSGNQLTTVYQRGNKTDMSRDGVLNGRDMDENDFARATRVDSFEDLLQSEEYPSEHPHAPIASMSMTAEEAYQWVVDSVGACLPDRDEVDEYVIDELRSLGNKGVIISSESVLGLVNGVGNIYNAPKPLDTDNDGMPDEWEKANGLDPNDATDAVKVAANGYLNIENYINSIPASPVPFLKYPVEILAKSLGTDSITVAFECHEKATGAKIRVEVMPEGGEYTTVETIGTDVTSYTVKGLSEKTNYTLRFTTFTDDMASLPAEFSFRTKGAPGEPDLSTDPIPANGETIAEYTTVTLKFSNEVTGRPYYYVYVGTSPDRLDSVATVRSRSYTMDVEPNTTYYWRIDVENTYGRTQGEVWNFTTGQEPVRTKVAYFAFDETSGSTAVNVPTGEEIMANDATPYGSYVPVWGEGKINGAILFDAANTTDGMIVPSYDEIVFESAPFSYELWFKSTAGNSSQSRYLLHKGSHKSDGDRNTGKWFGLEYKKGTLYFGVDDDVTKSLAEVSATSYFDGNWHHVVAVRDVENAKLLLYIDGELKASANDATGAIDGSEALVIGNVNVNFDSPFIGSIDEFTLYNDALTELEIKSKYEHGVTAIEEIAAQEREDVVVYPNPFKDRFTVTLPQSTGTVKVEIYSLSGALVYSNDLTVSGGMVEVKGLDDLPAGVYNCAVIADDTTRTARMMKY